MASPSSSSALQHQVATELSLGHEPAEECATPTSQAETIAKGDGQTSQKGEQGRQGRWSDYSEGADRAVVIDGAPSDASDETTETRAMGGDDTTLADTTPEPDGWQASTNATSLDHAQMLLSRWNSIIRSTVPQQKLSEVDSVFDSHVLESSAGEDVSSVDDRGLQGIRQASKEEECQQGTEESHRSETISESKKLDTTAEESNSVREVPAAAPSDGDETGKATLDDSFAELSDASPASTNGSVAPENSQIGEDTCQPVDASASLSDHAQVFLSQSISVVRSQVSKHNRSEASPRARTCVSESPDLANCCADAGQASEAAKECIEHVTPHEEAETESKPRVEGEEATVSLEGETGMASADDNASDEACSSSFTKTDGGVSTDGTSVSEATCKLVDDHASLLDSAQVFWSQSLSAVRSKVPELTRYIKDSKADSTQTALDADASQSQEAGTQAASSADEMSDEMYEFVNAASLQTLEGEVELQARTGAVGELSIRGSAVPPVASPTSDGATDSVPTPADHSDQAHVSATHLDHAQVFTSLAMAALRSRVAALEALTRPHSGCGGPNYLIVA